MKTHSRLLRGYNNNLFSDRHRERNTAPSATRGKINQQNGSRESHFSKPSLYTLPSVYSSKRDKK